MMTAVVTPTSDPAAATSGDPDSTDDPSGDLAHLLRRAGFSPRPAEVEEARRIGYHATVERLLEPPRVSDEDRWLLDRHLPAAGCPHEAGMAAPAWMWHLVTTSATLREKLTLFWHDLFATAFKQGVVGIDQAAQIEMLRRNGLGRFDELLLHLSQDPAMLVWLDNATSTAATCNENYGRELLELFAMGVGAYTEADVRASAESFTGWSVRRGPSAFHLGPRPSWFVYDAADHDHTPRTFLDREVVDGQDVVAAIVAHPATARFVSTRLYLWFVDDHPHDATIDDLADVFARTGGDVRAVLRALFLHPRFLDPAVRRAKVRSPVELVVGLARLTSRWEVPDHRLGELVDAAGLMGQTLLAPPNVGGWPNGRDWLQGSNLLERVNHASAQVRTSPVLREAIADLDAGDDDALLSGCRRLLDVDRLSSTSEEHLRMSLTRLGERRPDGEVVAHLLTLLIALPEFQYC